MKDQFKISAYAKINLFLDITTRRADGYHLLNSIMQQISLADELTVTVDKPGEEISLVTDEGLLPCGEKNLVYRGARAFFDTIGESRSLTVKLEKNIPMMAGLGGGSADCAAILRGLNRFYDNPLSAEQLCRLGAKLGADVPFCICGSTMRAEGIGEILTALPPLPSCYIVIAMGRESMPTPAAFAALDLLYDGFDARSPNLSGYHTMLDAIAAGNLTAAAGGLYNIFEDVVFPELPVLRERLTLFRQSGAIGTGMTGSGAAVFGMFTDPVDANRAAKAIRERGTDAWVCIPVHSPTP
ncbi:MAG: 4-(cytidine 5'-diphospho)-2-C-methyl-D-erythritol kinase [Clostridia bacterium]|nr:4-(cytidine 5'-diphospho)-2-C-methyl-D-erythritol kinase [Clostridia bacterium]